MKTTKTSLSHLSYLKEKLLFTTSVLIVFMVLENKPLSILTDHRVKNKNVPEKSNFLKGSKWKTHLNAYFQYIWLTYWRKTNFKSFSTF